MSRPNRIQRIIEEKGLSPDYADHAWIGVDFDGTLAEYHGWQGPDHCGEPIWPMVKRVRRWICEGVDVRIVTARCGPSNKGSEESAEAIRKWCKTWIGKELPVGCCKDLGMMELWDDSAIQTVFNTGARVDGCG